MGAVFDTTRTYRYSLWRQWQPLGAKIVFVMLNPSTADDRTNDPTIRRCIGLAQSWGYGALEVVNLFARMTSQPHTLRQIADPVGAECDRYLLTAVHQAKTVVVAWGNWGNWRQRDRAVLNLLGDRAVFCVGVNRSGQPRHPLYVRQNVQPVLYLRPNPESAR